MTTAAQRRADTQSRQGAAMAASGTVLGGTGLVAGGIPGAREPNALSVWNLKGKPTARSRLSRSNLPGNAKILAPQPRAGILGFRANTHDAYIQEMKDKPVRSAYQRGNVAGKLEAEAPIVRGMRMGRRAAHPLTLGGFFLAAAGEHRMHRKVGKRDRERGVVAGTAGVAAGTASGAVAGIRGGASAGRKVIDAKLNAEWESAHGSSSSLPPAPKGHRYFVSGGEAFPRRVAAMSRGARTGAALGAATLGVAGYRLARGRKVGKADPRRQNASAAALAGGGTVAAVGHVVPKGLDRFGRRYEQSSKEHVKQAQRLAPHLGGLQKTPAKVNPFGVVVRPERETMKPEIPNWKIEQSPDLQRKINPRHRAEVGRHRGIAANEKHFAEVFDNTARGIRRVRGPGLALAGAGAMGLWASQDKVRKDVRYGYQSRRRSPVRTTEMLAGGALVAYGASRMQMVGSLAAYGARIAEKQGARPDQIERVLSAARAVGHGVRETTGNGEAQARKIKALDRAISAVPSGLRPAVATTAGVMLMSHAHPTTRNTFTPIGRY